MRSLRSSRRHVRSTRRRGVAATALARARSSLSSIDSSPSSSRQHVALCGCSRTALLAFNGSMIVERCTGWTCDRRRHPKKYLSGPSHARSPSVTERVRPSVMSTSPKLSLTGAHVGGGAHFAESMRLGRGSYPTKVAARLPADEGCLRGARSLPPEKPLCGVKSHAGRG